MTDMNPEEEAFYKQFEALKSSVSYERGCPKCNWREYTVDENGKATCCDCWRKRVIRKLALEAGLPEAYIGRELVDWNLKQDAKGEDLSPLDKKKKNGVKLFMEKYLQFIVPICAGMPLKLKLGNVYESVTSLLFVGDSASGKTLLACIIAQAALRKGLSVKFLEWSELDAMFSDYDRRDEQNELAEECRRVDVLIIDGITDYGNNHPLFFSQLDRIANIRLNSKRPTILTAHSSYQTMRCHHGWKNLVASCQAITLPSPRF